MTKSKLALMLCAPAIVAGCYSQEPVGSVEVGGTSSAVVVDKGWIGAVPSGWVGTGCGGSVPSGTALDGMVRSVLDECNELYDVHHTVNDIDFNVAWATNLDGREFLLVEPAVEQYVDDIQAAADYSRRKMSGRAYKRNLNSLLENDLGYYLDLQNREIERPDPRIAAPLEDFEEAFKEKFEAQIAPVVTDLAEKKKATISLRRILATHRAKVVSLGVAYADLVTRFKAYKALEATVVADLTRLSTQASAAPLQGLPQIQIELVDYMRRASAASNDLSVDAARLLGTLSWNDREYADSIAWYADFLEEHPGLVPTNLTADAQRSVANMIAYIEERRMQTDAQTSTLLRGISARSRALVLLAADEETRQARRDAAHVRASTRFLDEATARDVEISAQAPRTTKYRYYLWTEKYDSYVSFLELEPLCTASDTPSWRDTGCIALNRGFVTARNYMTTTIPRLIRLTIPQLRRKGVAESILAGIETELAAGRTREAIVRYDVAARMTEDM